MSQIAGLYNSPILAYDAHVSTALARFLQRQLDARGMTADQFAKKHHLNSSGLYQLLRGERTYVQDRTLERLAVALGMTLAEMVTDMGMGGLSELRPDQVEVLTLYEQVPTDHRTAAKAMLGGLRDPAAANTSDRDTANSSGSRVSGRQRTHTPPLQSQNRGVLVGLAAAILPAIWPFVPRRSELAAVSA